MEVKQIEESIRVESFIEGEPLPIKWNETLVDYPNQELCIHELFELQVGRTPDRMAVICPAFGPPDAGQQLTYEELNQRANQLAHHLRKMGVGPNVLVGIYIKPSLEMVVGLLAILKAGGAYLPLDPIYPQKRLAFMLQETQVLLLLTQKKLLNELPDITHECEVLCLDGESQVLEQESTSNPSHQVTADGLACLIYTSGSTGQPMGVMMPHRAITHQIFWRNDQFQVTAEDRILQSSSFAFAPSLWELFGPLSVGSQVILATSDKKNSNRSEYLTKLIAEQKVTMLQVVPSMLRMLLEESAFENHMWLKRVLCGGARLSYEWQKRFFARQPSAQLHHLYGPTEAGFGVTCWTCEPAPDKDKDKDKDSDNDSPKDAYWSHFVPIGHPVANTRLYLLDADRQPVPIGVAGEVYIGGPLLAQGYHKQPEQTAELFIPDPFSQEESARLYKTGDLARYLPDGCFEFLGRVDNQVKIGGVPIELTEIEATIEQHPAVKDAVVVAHRHEAEDQDQDNGDPFLVAYLVADLAVDRVHWESKCRVEIQDGPVINLTTVDLSPNGVGLRDVPPFMQSGNQVRCTLQLPTRGLIRQDMTKVLNIPISFKGSVAWYNRETKRAGILFQATREQEHLLAQSVKLLTQTQGIEVADLRSDEPRVPWRTSCLAQFEDRPVTELTTENISPDGVRLVADLEANPSQADIWEVGQRLHLCLPLPTEIHTYAEWESPSRPSPENSDTAAQHLLHRTSLWITGTVLWYHQNRAGIQFETTPEKRAFLTKSVEYITVNKGYSLAHLRAYLSQKVDSQMLPSTFVLIESVPLTPNGQIDRDALPAPAKVRQQSQDTYLAPQNNLEWQLTKIWEYAFDLRPIGVRDNFFDLGGDSLLAMRILAELEKINQPKMPLTVLVEAQTIEQLALFLTHKEAVQKAITRHSPLVPIQPQGTNAPFFLVAPLGDDILHFATLGHQLAPEQPFYAVQHPLESAELIHTRLEEIAAHYIKEIQTIQPEGPYFLGGHCFGGWLAYEMAQQLHRQNQEVALLALIETYPPDQLHPLPAQRTNKEPNHQPSRRTLPATAIQEKVQEIWKGPVWGNVWKMGYKLHQATGRSLPNFLRDAIQINQELLKQYTIQPYAGQLTLIQAQQSQKGHSPPPQTGSGWQHLAANLAIHQVPGDHMTIWQPSHVPHLAEKLRACIKQATK